MFRPRRRVCAGGMVIGRMAAQSMGANYRWAAAGLSVRVAGASRVRDIPRMVHDPAGAGIGAEQMSIFTTLATNKEV